MVDVAGAPGTPAAMQDMSPANTPRPDSQEEQEQQEPQSPLRAATQKVVKVARKVQGLLLVGDESGAESADLDSASGGETCSEMRRRTMRPWMRCCGGLQKT